MGGVVQVFPHVADNVVRLLEQPRQLRVVVTNMTGQALERPEIEMQYGAQVQPVPANTIVQHGQSFVVDAGAGVGVYGINGVIRLWCVDGQKRAVVLLLM